MLIEDLKNNRKTNQKRRKTDGMSNKIQLVLNRLLLIMSMVEFGSIRGWQMCRPQGLKDTIQFPPTNVIPLGWIKTDNSQGRSLLKTRVEDETERDGAFAQSVQTIPIRA